MKASVSINVSGERCWKDAYDQVAYLDSETFWPLHVIKTKDGSTEAGRVSLTINGSFITVYGASTAQVLYSESVTAPNGVGSTSIDKACEFIFKYREQVGFND
jgi:hypothetical protein